MKDLVIVALMLIAGFWWVISFASLMTSTVPMTITFFVTSFLLVWFCCANFIKR